MVSWRRVEEQLIAVPHYKAQISMAFGSEGSPSKKDFPENQIVSHNRLHKCVRKLTARKETAANTAAILNGKYGVQSARIKKQYLFYEKYIDSLKNEQKTLKSMGIRSMTEALYVHEISLIVDDITKFLARP